MLFSKINYESDFSFDMVLRYINIFINLSIDGGLSDLQCISELEMSIKSDWKRSDGFEMEAKMSQTMGFVVKGSLLDQL